MKVTIRRREGNEPGPAVGSGYEVLFDGQNLDQALGIRDVAVKLPLDDAPQVRLDCISTEIDLEVETDMLQVHVANPQRGLSRLFALRPLEDAIVTDPKVHGLAKLEGKTDGGQELAE